MAPLDDLIHSVFVSFEDSLHTTVPTVFNPTFHSESESCLLSVVTKEDPLDPSFNDDPRPDPFHNDLESITRSS
jgi:hypothetical protein